MDLGLQGKTCLVTGASAGLGAAVARQLAREGARLVLAARGEARLRETAAAIVVETGAEVLAVPADLDRPDDIAALTAAARDAGGTDVLVSNTGPPPFGRFAELGDGDWVLAIDRVFMSAVRLARAVAPDMQRRGGGRIVFVSAATVKQPVIAGAVASTATRMGLAGLNKALAKELAPHDILVNTVLPGWFDTGAFRQVIADAAARSGRSPEDVLAQFLSRVPMGRLGDPAELASLVAFICSGRSSYLTGTVIQVDGGMVDYPL